MVKDVSDIHALTLSHNPHSESCLMQPMILETLGIRSWAIRGKWELFSNLNLRSFIIPVDHDETLWTDIPGSSFLYIFKGRQEAYEIESRLHPSALSPVSLSSSVFSDLEDRM